MIIIFLFAEVASANWYYNSQYYMQPPQSIIIRGRIIVGPTSSDMDKYCLPAQLATTPEGVVKTGSTWELIDGVYVETGEYQTHEEYDAEQEAALQAAKPEKLKVAENKFFDLCFAIFGDREKRGFDELNTAIEAMTTTDPNTATALAIRLLAVDAECKREGGNQWWDTAAYHEEIVE